MTAREDISHESVRIYTFPDQEQVRVHDPATLRAYTDHSGIETHEIRDQRGGLYVIKQGWRTMRSVAKKPAGDV